MSRNIFSEGVFASKILDELEGGSEDSNAPSAYLSVMGKIRNKLIGLDASNHEASDHEASDHEASDHEASDHVVTEQLLEFDGIANDILSGAKKMVIPEVIRSADIALAVLEALEEVERELQSSIESEASSDEVISVGYQRTVIEEIRTKFTNSVSPEVLDFIIIKLKSDPTEASRFQQHGYISGALNMLTKLQRAEVGQILGLRKAFQDGYLKAVRDKYSRLFHVSDEAKKNVLSDETMYSAYSVGEGFGKIGRYLQMEMTQASLLTEMSLAGKQSATIINSDGYYGVLESIDPRPPFVVEAAKKLVADGSSTLVDHVRIKIDEYIGSSPDDNHHDLSQKANEALERAKSIPILQRGIVEGVLACDEPFFSVAQLIRKAGSSTGQREGAFIQELHKHELYKQGCIAGYIVGNLDGRNIFEDTDLILSLRKAYNALDSSSLQLKTSIEKILRNFQKTENFVGSNNRVAIALVLGDSQELSEPETMLWRERQDRLEKDRQERSEQYVKETIYGNKHACFVDKYFLAFDNYQARMDSSEGVDIVRKVGRDAIALREASFQALSQMLIHLNIRAGEKSTAPTWEDAEVVIELIEQSNISLRSENDIELLLTDRVGNLTLEQKRLVVMLRLSHLMSGGMISGNVDSRLREINKYIDDGLISPDDIITAHNSTLIAVEGVGRAYAKSSIAEEKQPLRFHEIVDLLARQNSRTDIYPYLSTPIGPFVKRQPITTGFRVGSLSKTASDGQPAYYKGDGNVNVEKIPFYINGGGEKVVQESIKVVSLQAANVFELFDRTADMIRVSQFPRRSFERIIDPEVFPNYVARLSDLRVNDESAKYTWDFFSVMRSQQTGVLKTMTSQEPGSFRSVIKDAEHAISQYKIIFEKLSGLSQFLKENTAFIKRGKRKNQAAEVRNEISEILDNVPTANEISVPGNLHEDKVVQDYIQSLRTWLVGQTRLVHDALKIIDGDLDKLAVYPLELASQRVKIIKDSGEVSFHFSDLNLDHFTYQEGVSPLRLPLVQPSRNPAYTDPADSLKALIREFDLLAIQPGLRSLVDTLGEEKRRYGYFSWEQDQKDQEPERLGYLLNNFIQAFNFAIVDLPHQSDEQMGNLIQEVDQIKSLITAMVEKVRQLSNFTNGREMLQKALEAAYQVEASKIANLEEGKFIELLHLSADKLPSSIRGPLLANLSQE